MAWRQTLAGNLHGRTVSLMRREFLEFDPWSNCELRRLAPLLGGDVIHVSPWEDKDKERWELSGLLHVRQVPM